MKEVRNIEKGMFNGKRVKFFDVWEKVENAWVFAGKFVAPKKTANKDLLSFSER